MSATPYGDAAMTYLSRGWAPLPLPPRRKKPPPTGWTGYAAPYPSGADVTEWATNDKADHNIGLRMPETVLGLDVDCYDGKPGEQTMLDAIDRLGPLPPTPRSTSRHDDAVSGIRFYRVPAGRRWADTLGGEGSGVEVIHHGHRYAAAAPSIHPEGRTYGWYDAVEPRSEPPAVDDLPDLPATWVTELDAGSAEDVAAKADVTSADVKAWLDALPAGSPCRYLTRLLSDLADTLGSDASRHDTARNAVARIARVGDQGHTGAVEALGRAHKLWLAALKRGKPRRPDPGEWARMVTGAVAMCTAQPAPAADKSCCPEVPPATTIDADPCTLDECHATFRRWLGAEYDLDVLDVMLCALAAERLEGDPLWLLIISGPGAAKTETVQAARGVGALIESTITGEAALLSGTPKKERAKNATGGLLRVLGDAGVLVIKDVTSVLSMSRDRRAEVLAALREVYDGYWSRSIGAEGGRTLTWSGRVAVIGAVTTAWDTAHSVVAAMGDRFVNVRLDSKTGRQAAFRQTMANTGDETAMRAELAAAVGGVIAGLDPSVNLSLTEDEIVRLGAAANLVTLARTGVEYDYKGDVIDAHAPEMPTRFARQLQQIIRGGLALGIDRHQALRLAIRAARDTMPPIRLAIVDDLADHPHSTPPDIRRRVDLPWRTVDRQCQALHMLGVLGCDEEPYGDSGRSRWYYTLTEGIDPVALKSAPVMYPPPPRPTRREGKEGNQEDTPRGSTANTGAHSQQVSTHTCRRCGTLTTPERAAVNTCCEACDADIRAGQPPLPEAGAAT